MSDAKNYLITAEEEELIWLNFPQLKWRRNNPYDNYKWQSMSGIINDSWFEIIIRKKVESVVAYELLLASKETGDEITDDGLYKDELITVNQGIALQDVISNGKQNLVAMIECLENKVKARQFPKKGEIWEHWEKKDLYEIVELGNLQFSGANLLEYGELNKEKCVVVKKLETKEVIVKLLTEFMAISKEGDCYAFTLVDKQID